MWQTYYQPTTLSEALDLLREHAGQSRIVAGGTDLLVELQRGIRPTNTVIDVSRVVELKYVRTEEGQIRLGALATHNNVIASPLCVAHALPLAQACWEVGAPQIRTRATVVGNLVTASPANDTITPLMALGAELVLAHSAGERVVPLHAFYTGVRRTALAPGELVREIRVPALESNQRGLFLKLGLRRAQAISVVNLALVLTFDGSTVTDARITLGCVAPTIIRASEAEAFLVGKTLDETTCQEAGKLARRSATPIDDLRGSAHYRVTTLEGLITQGLLRIVAGAHAEGWLETPVLLETEGSEQKAEGGEQKAEGSEQKAEGRRHNVGLSLCGSQPLHDSQTITTHINGQAYELHHAHNKTLLDALRDNPELTGTKEGCAEGECGACTVWLNGQAVMACLVPAPQVQDAEITTIEGLGAEGGRQKAEGSEQEAEGRRQKAGGRRQKAGGSAQEAAGSEKEAEGSEQNVEGNPALHPLQRAFIERGAVQCGYCIPGMLMAGAKLLDEHPQPDLAQTQVALSGNICRCTGYKKIFDAVMAASQEVEDQEPA